MLACRFCGSTQLRTFVDLGYTPLANAYLSSSEAIESERRYPLHARVCERCLLVQVDAVVSPQHLFTEYAYFSSYSSSWTEHARRFALQAIKQVGLNGSSRVLEVASNDGYLLRHFMAEGIPVLGIDPAANVARVAVDAGIPTTVAFFGKDVALQMQTAEQQADLIIANNVLAHVPDLNDFVGGLSLALKATGVVTIEIPHLLHLIEGVQFDTIYHEHFSYFSLLSAEQVLRSQGLAVFDVEELPTHGGSLRLWAGHAATVGQPSQRLISLRGRERKAGLHEVAGYQGFAERVEQCRASLLSFLASARSANRMVVGYGAAAKGNTLLNYCSVTATDVPYVVDRNPHKQGTLLPGSHIPVVDPGCVMDLRPPYVLVLPWNIKDEICEQMAFIREWGGRFVFPIPTVTVE